MYEQVFDPVGDSLGLSAIFAALPLLTLFVMLGGVQGHRLEGRASRPWWCRWWWRSPSTACPSGRR